MLTVPADQFLTEVIEPEFDVDNPSVIAHSTIEDNRITVGFAVGLGHRDSLQFPDSDDMGHSCVYNNDAVTAYIDSAGSIVILEAADEDTVEEDTRNIFRDELIELDALDDEQEAMVEDLTVEMYPDEVEIIIGWQVDYGAF